MLPWFEPEITPFVPGAGVRRYALDPADASANVRAVVEAQAIAMALHSQWMGVDVRTIYATGGAAVNQEILGVIADVFGADVYQRAVARGANSAALGAALRAYHADRKSDGEDLAWIDVVAGFAAPREATPIRPRPENIGAYARLKQVYADCEARALSEQPRSLTYESE